jgi:ankyrin repeat protein
MMDNGKPPQTSSSSSEHVNPSPSGVGLCDTCGIPTHQRKAFWKRDPFTNENVYQGICIQCHGESVPASVFWEWHSQKTKRSHSLLSSPTGAPWNSLHSFSTEDSSSKVKPHQKHPSQRQKDNKLSFAALTNIDTTVQQEDLEEKYWKLLKLFQSCRTDPTRPTPQELEQLPFSEEDWRSLVLIQTTDLGCRFLQLALVYRSPYPAIRFLLQKDVDSRWTVRHEDVHGSLPLHYACRYGASIDVFELLMREDQIYNKTIHHADKQGCLPLHVACRHASNNAIFKFLLDKDGEEKAILRRDENGYLPIHLALERNSALQTIELLVAADILKSTLHAPNPSGLTTISEIAMKYDYHALLGSNYVQLLDAVVEEMNIHTACRFGVPMESIELLLDMDSNQSVYKIDQDDNLPLHCALDGSASAEIIRHLIKVDTFKTTLHQKNKDGSTPLLKIVLREDSLSLLQGFPSLLQAAKDLDVVQEMNLSVKKKCEVSLELQIKHTKLISTIWQRREIESRPSVAELTGLGFTEEVWRRIVLIENDDTGWLPLQWALAFGAPPTTISFLLEKDFEHQSIYHPSLSGSLPIHFACLREFSFDVIQSLLEKDATRTTILEKNSSGKRPLDLLPKDSDVIANLVKDVQKLDAQPDTLDFFFESSPPELFQPAMLESMEPNKANVNSFEWLNHAYCQDLVIVFVMLEFYLLLAWLGIFIHSSILHVTDEEVPLALAILLQAMALLVLAIKLRRLFKTASLQSYFTDMYNLLGLGAIGLVVASSVMLSSNGTTFPDERALLMTTGAFQFALLIAFLKRMFHSIATFVGGVILVGIQCLVSNRTSR